MNHYYLRAPRPTDTNFLAAASGFGGTAEDIPLEILSSFSISFFLYINLDKQVRYPTPDSGFFLFNVFKHGVWECIDMVASAFWLSMGFWGGEIITMDQPLASWKTKVLGPSMGLGFRMVGVTKVYLVMY